MGVKNLNGSDLAFEQDKHILFDEAQHAYSLDNGTELTPVSHVVSQFFRPFNAEYWSLRKCDGNERDAERLREQWKCKGQCASQAGTFLHKQIEDYINGCHDGAMACEVCYDGNLVHHRETVDITPEWHHFLAFDRNIDYTPFRTEWRVYDLEHRIAGTIDLLCACPDGTYEIYDWKRSNKVDPSEVNHFDSGINGLEHLTDTSYVHYCMQQNLYRNILEQNYGLRISRMNLVVLHPDYGNYRLVPVPRMQREVDIVLSKL